VWSLAVIAYALLFGSFPYTPKEQSSKAMKKAIVDGVPPTFQPSANAVQTRSDTAIEFVRTLLDRDAERRPTAVDALKTMYMVNAKDGNHMINSELPSLRPALFAARKAGAFEVRDPSRETPVDKVLSKLQVSQHGIPLPEVRPTKELPQECGKKTRSTRSKKSSAESEVTSCPSNMWDNSSISCDSSAGSTRASSFGNLGKSHSGSPVPSPVAVRT
jgi:serine/threonine protein kinase